MHAGYAVVLLLLTPGSARLEPDLVAAGRESAAMQAGAPPAARPATPTQPKAEPAKPQEETAKPQPEPAKPQPAPAKPPDAPAPPAPGPGAAAPPAASKDALPVAKAPAGDPTLDLKMLEQQLRATKAIGFFTKITLKNKVDDLLDEIGDYYNGDRKHTMADLRRSYDLLLMKVLSLLQDEDPKLASAIVSSREAIWDMLADPKKFAALRG
jgi:hypothetical protein